MPDFYTDGDTPRIGDTLYRTTMKILGSLAGGAGGAAAGGTLFGSGSPEGVVTAGPGKLYLDTDAPGTLYFKLTGTGNTGWV